MGAVGLILSAAIGTLVKLAHRRLVSPIDGQWRVPNSMAGPTLLKRAGPARPTLISTRRPSPVAALLWQQVRQFRGIAGIIAVAFSLAMLWIGSTGGGEIWRWFIIWPLTAVIVGVATFHGDRIDPRRGFLADRGLPPTLVWVTRLLPPLVFLGALSLAFAWIAQRHDQADYWIGKRIAETIPLWVALTIALFLIGVSAGQWGRRTSLAFAGAPVLAGLWSGPVLQLLMFYDDYVWWLWAAAAVWLFATWRLTSMMLAGRQGAALWGRGLAYAALAWAVFAGGVLGNRWWTTPLELPRWRASMVALELPPADAATEALVSFNRTYQQARFTYQSFARPSLASNWSELLAEREFGGIDPTRVANLNTILVLDSNAVLPTTTAVGSQSVDAILKRIEDELSGDQRDSDSLSALEMLEILVELPARRRKGQYDRKAFRLNAYVNESDYRRLRRAAIELALQRAEQVRRAPAEATLGAVLMVAEAGEKLATAGLRQIAIEQGAFDRSAAVVVASADQADREAFDRLTRAIRFRGSPAAFASVVAGAALATVQRIAPAVPPRFVEDRTPLPRDVVLVAATPVGNRTAADSSHDRRRGPSNAAVDPRHAAKPGRSGDRRPGRLMARDPGTRFGPRRQAGPAGATDRGGIADRSSGLRR